MATSETAINFLQRNMDIGRPIPGQSLTNDPKNPYAWEKPPEFSDPQRAMLQIFETLTEKDTLSNTLLSLVKGVSVIDISSIVLYSGFLEGKWNPDLMILLSEPTMYMIIALCEKADLEYKLESTDDEVAVTELEPQEQINKLNEGTAYLKTLRKKASSGINENVIPEELKQEIEATEIPDSLLNKKIIEEDNTSLLSRGDKNGD